MQYPDAQLIVDNLKPYANVQDLPHELVADILSIVALDPASDLARSTDWLQLQLVCRYWHTIACSTARLWADIRAHPKVRIEWLRLCLERSAQAPLTLLLVALPEGTYGELLPMLARPENSCRIRVLRVRFLDVPRLLPALFSLPMPSLVRLEASRECHSMILPPWHFRPIYPRKENHLAPCCPRLHTLKLADMVFPKNPAFYANLRSLALHQQSHSHHQLSLADLVAVLRAIHRLEALDLSYFEPCVGDSDSGPESDQPIADAAIYLPHLRHYTIHNAVSVLTRVNRLLVFPPTCTIVLSIRLNPWPGAVAGPVYTSSHAALADILTPCIRVALQDAVAMTVSCGDGHFAVRIPESGVAVSGLPAGPPESDAAAPRGGVNVFYASCWGIELNMPRPAFGAFVPFCPSDRLTSLTFGRVKETYPAARWAAVFRAYSTLQRITLAEAHSDVSDVFIALAPGTRPRGTREEGAGEGQDEDGDGDGENEDDETEQELLCPALRHIEVRLRMRTSKGLTRWSGAPLRARRVEQVRSA